ncbi:MAG: hypothetical protein Q9218_003611 [Villophora microphyllina]
MKDQNPDNPILHEALNGAQSHNNTPAKTPKKRDLDTMMNIGFQGSTSSAPHTFPIPKPNLERDFQMSVQLNPKISVGPGIWGQRNWVSFISGHWNGRWGKGTVVPGGQDSQLIAPDLSTHIDANYLLQTHDHPPAFIAVKMDGWRVGPREILEKLEDPAHIDEIDPKTYSFRVYVHMETGDTRYLHLNTGMWIGSGVRRGTEACPKNHLHPPNLEWPATNTYMETITIPSPSAFLSSPVLTSSIDSNASKVSPKSRKKQYATFEKPFPRTESNGRPKQSKSRNGT